MNKLDYMALGGCVLVGYSIYSLAGFAILCGVAGVAVIGLSLYLARKESVQ